MVSTSPELEAFGRSALVQWRVIIALLLRDLVIAGGRGPIPFFGIYIRPVIVVAVFYIVGRVATEITPQGFPLLVFIITGYFTWIGFFRSFSGVQFAGQGLLLFPQVTPLDLALAKMASAWTMQTFLFAVLVGVAMLFEQAPGPADPLGVVMAFWCTVWLGLAIGLIAATISRFTTLLDDFWIGVRMIGHAVSGVFTLGTALPSELLAWMKWNPIFHCIEWLRESWWPAYHSPIADPNYVFLCLFFLTAAALAFERATRRWHTE